jgi:hypothetical protein
MLHILKDNGHLKSLIMDNNMFDGQTFNIVESFFIFNNALTHMSWNNCAINDEMATAIGRGLSKNVKL